MTKLFDLTIVFLCLHLTYKIYGYSCFNDIMDKISNEDADKEPERACGRKEKDAEEGFF